MTARTPRPCSVPGCPNLVTDATAQCIEHRRRTDRQRVQRPYDQGNWRKVARAHRKAHPLCQECGRAWSTETDHIDGDATNNRAENLRSLCGLCHRRRTARDQPGGARDA